MEHIGIDLHRRESQICIEREAIAVVGLVADEPLGEFRDKAGVERGADELDFSWRSTGHVDSERKAMAIDNCHEL